MKNQRSTLIVDKSFQYSQIIPVVMIAVLAANSVLIAIFFLLGSEFTGRLQLFIWLVAAIEVFFIVAAIYYGARTSNRIAGPIYRIKKVMRDVADGDLTCRIELREHDHLQDLAQEINDVLVGLDSRVQALQAVEHAIREQAGDDHNMNVTLSELSHLLGQFKVSSTGP